MDAKASAPKAALAIVLAEAVKGLFLFGATGGLGWWQAWLYLASGLVFGLLGTTVFRGAPGLQAERRGALAQAPAWDRRLLLLTLLLLPTALYVVAGLDQRRHWSPSVPAWLSLAALLPLAAGSLLFLWAQRVNAFFSSVARIQTERGHQVQRGGPYRWVRHPGYAGLILGSLATPVLLGSWAALPLGVLIAALTVLRTALEDRLLRRELPGYADYAAELRWRLLPGLW